MDLSPSNAFISATVPDPPSWRKASMHRSVFVFIIRTDIFHSIKSALSVPPFLRSLVKV